jgi:hypothetical protein
MLRRTAAIAACAMASSLALGALAEAQAAPAKASASQVGKATRMLQGKRYWTYITGNLSNAGIDRTVDLCPGGRYFYESVFSYIPEGVDVERRTGSWRVVAARVGRRNGWARVSYSLDGGGGGTFTIVGNPRGVYANGSPVEVTRSPQC